MMTNKVEIITNNQPRNLIYGYELTDKEREDFDYIDEDEIDGHDFVRYRGNVYDIGEFMLCQDEDLTSQGWTGYFTDSAFSAILIKYYDQDEVIMGLALV